MTLATALQTGFQGTSSIPRNIVIVCVGSLLLTLSAKINVPFYPVPQTMQTFAVVGLGLALGSRLAVASVVLYLAQGALGLPVFSGTPEMGIGIAYMTGPTGGYLLGFVAAAWLAGTLAERGWDRSVMWAFLAAILSTAVIFIPGLVWLGSILGWDVPVLSLGLYPFLLGGVVKSVLASLTFPATWSFLKNRGLV